MLAVFTGLKHLQKHKITLKKGGEFMLTNLLTIVIPSDPFGIGGENPAWPFCTSPVFAIFNWLF